MCSLFDLHTHHDRAGHVALINRYESFAALSTENFYTVGLHPWYLNEHAEEAFEQLSISAKKKNVLAIGECGLDKVCDTDWSLQQVWYEKQITLAKSLNKPLIIHCVRAFEEVMAVLKNNQVTVPVIFHGFNKNAQLARRLIDQGYYLSFGKHLKNEGVREVLRSIPIERVFLETDDSTLSIAEVYSLAANALGISLESLAHHIEANVHSVFGKDIVL
jgi:TatD DNase family protein